ncbi:hypothetical protein [Dyadobacter sp. NIV53]|nr:hypothetical protein [Dyadobacter sp. NIV53]
MKSYKIGDNATDFASICEGVKDMVENALPDASKVDGLDKYLR